LTTSQVFFFFNIARPAMEAVALLGLAAAASALLRARADGTHRLTGVDERTGVDNALLAVLHKHRARFGRAARRLFALDWRFTHLNHGSYGTAPLAVMAAAAQEVGRRVWT
jgi:hypothetical protein